MRVPPCHSVVLREHLQKRAHEHLVVLFRPVANPLHGQAVRTKRPADEAEVLARVENAGAGHGRVNHVGGDDVVPVVGQPKVVAAIVNSEADVRPVQDVVVHVRELGGGEAHALRQFHDVE